MKTVKHATVLILVLVVCLSIFTCAEDIRKAVQGIESDAKIIYNGREVNLAQKPVSIDGYNYLPVRALSDLFGKDIAWNQAENKIDIKDRSNPVIESLNGELASKNKSIAELQEKLKTLENNLAVNKKISMEELQNKINDEYGEYDGLTYKVILSGNEDEVRVKVEVDLSRDKASWSHLPMNKRAEMLQAFCSIITNEYENAKIKGYVKDISEPKRLLTFYSTSDGKISIGPYRNYSDISTLEDSFNNDYDSYLNDMNLTFQLKGNENRIEYIVNIQMEKYESEWNGLSDPTVKNFMKKLSSDIKKEFGEECEVYGHIYDIDGRADLAYCESIAGSEFEFNREQ